MAHQQGLARNSHVVPRFLIARFADDKGQVLLFDKQKGNEERRNPTSFTERDFYLIDTGKGPSDVIERHMDVKIEAPTATALQRIDAGEWPPSEERRARIALFMAVQLNRGKEFRTLMDGLAEEQRKRKVEPLYPELGEEALAKISEVAAEKALQIAKSKEFQIKAMLDAAPKIATVLYERHWILLSGNGFLTGDMPISKWQKEGGLGQVGWDIGIAVADEILMPISTAAAILIVPSSEAVKKVDRFALPDAGVAQARALIWASAQRFTYRHPNTPAVAAVDQAVRHAKKQELPSSPTGSASLSLSDGGNSPDYAQAAANRRRRYGEPTNQAPPTPTSCLRCESTPLAPVWRGLLCWRCGWIWRDHD